MHAPQSEERGIHPLQPLQEIGAVAVGGYDQQNGQEPTIGGEQEVSTASYRFVLCEHIAENAGEIAAQLEGCDVIAFECVGLKDKAAQTRLGEVATGIVSSRLNDAARKTALEMITANVDVELGRGEGLLFIAEVLDKLAKTNKTIRFIDITKDHPSYPKVVGYKDATDKYHQSIKELRDNSEIRNRLRDEAHAIVPIVADRDKIMTDDCMELGSDFPGMQIGVVIGKEHTAVSRSAKGSAPVEEVFVESDNPSPRDELFHAVLSDPDLQISRDMLDRAIVADLYTGFGIQSIGVNGGNEVDTHVTADHFVRNLSSEQISTIMDSLDAIKQNRANRISFGRLKRKTHEFLIQTTECAGLL